MSRLLLVAVVGDNSTDTEDDARWTLGPRAPMATDGWVGGIRTGSTGGCATIETREGSGGSAPVMLHFEKLLSHVSTCLTL